MNLPPAVDDGCPRNVQDGWLKELKMSKVALTIAVVLTLVGAMATPSLVVRAQGTTRFEYARVTPYIERTVAEGPNVPVWKTVQVRIGYRACVAGVTGWACQDFKPAEASDALRIALVQLGS